MRKLIVTLLVVVLFLAGCSNNSESGIFEDSLIEVANSFTESSWSEYFQDNPFEKGERVYEVSSLGDNTYSVNVNGTKQTMKFHRNSTNTVVVPTETFKITSKSQKIVKESMELIVDFIQSSKILENKEEIIDFIKSLEIKSAYFEDEENTTVAYFYGDVKSIFIEKSNEKLLCEWIIVHELIHAISYYTHGQTMDYEYSYSLFNEVLTDLITFSINPKTLEGEYASGYSMYYSYIFPYISIFKIDSLKSYFYGYKKDFIIPKHEIDFFVNVIEMLPENPDIEPHYNNLIIKWQYLLSIENSQEVGLLPNFLLYNKFF